MVKIIDYKLRENNEGESFFVLIVQGAPEVLVSKDSGKAYVTSRKASVSCTFDETTCKSLIGSSLTGQIIKVETDEPYEYTAPTGEVIELTYRWEFVNESTTEDAVFENQIVQPLV